MLTVCGLPAKRLCKANKPTSFRLKHTSDKEKSNYYCLFIASSSLCYYVLVILSWLLDQECIRPVLNGKLVEEDMVECRPEKISNAIIDENVDIHLVRRYFSNDAWLLVQDVVRRKKETDVWTCAVCYHNLDQGESIICESCLEWHHFNCVGITRQPKSKNWFCRKCCGNR